MGASTTKVRKDGYVMLNSDRIPGIVGISAPVWNASQTLEGALTLTAPEQRVKGHFVDELRLSARRLTEALGGRPC